MNTENDVVGVFGSDGEPDRGVAFEAGYPGDFRGRKLEGWDVVRESHFLIMRAQAGAPAMSSLLDQPGAFLADALRVLFLCSVGHGEMRRLARSGGLQEACDEWSAAAVPARETGAAIEAGLEIYNLAHSCDTVPIGRDDGEEVGGDDGAGK